MAHLWSYNDWHELGQPVQRHVSLAGTGGTALNYTRMLMQVTDGNGNVVTSTAYLYYDYRIILWRL